ncbi:MAG: thiamine phosphate synthase [Sedimentisphaerales bacterium]|nr:thiamine phosphate synthase [Sedimentisphaerales bacterium]
MALNHAVASYNGVMDSQVLRLLDANFNRSREALRVLEDAGRFILDDSALSEAAKALRHELCQVMAGAAAEGAAWRDTPGDVGTSIATVAEGRREDVQAVVSAAGKRLSEALRCLEEYMKISSSEAAGKIEQIRYRGYELEKQLVTRLERVGKMAGVGVYVLLTTSMCYHPVMKIAKEIVEAGVDCIQLREKDRNDRDLVGLAQDMGDLCRSRGTLFIVNDRPDVALAVGADGVHLGQEDMPVAAARKVLGGRKIVGVSTHNAKELEAAVAERPDYLAVGAIYRSRTKSSVSVVGLEYIRQAREAYGGPIIAIGGIGPDTAAEVIAAGATGVAVSHAVMGDLAPGLVVEKLKKAVMA